MALPAGVTKLGSFKGDKGDTGVLASLDVQLLPWNAAPFAEMTGPLENRGAVIHIPMPTPGPETVNNDDATEALVLMPTKTQAALLGSFAGYDVIEAATGLADATSAFVAAATAAKAAGRNALRVAPGVYHVPGLHPDDILGMYIIGDGVTLTGPAWVYPFTTSELTARSAQATSGSGRGVIAFEVDDSQDAHWTELFPLTKELGVTFGSAWHTRSAPWMKEAVRHGWEAISHFPDDWPATTLTDAELEQYAEETIDALEQVTGTRDGHGHVYVQHLRNAHTDQILSKYFARARGFSGRNAYPRDAPNPWLYQAYDMDAHIGSGVLSNEMKGILEAVASTDSKIVFLSHWRLEGAAVRAQGFRELVAYARNLGIEFRNPKQLMTRSQVVGDPYFNSVGADGWALSVSGHAAWDETTAYHGARSAWLKPSGVGYVEGKAVNLGTRPGYFTVIRPSMRVQTAGAEASNATQGILFSLAGAVRQADGSVASTGQVQFQPPLLPGPTIGPQNWVRHRRTYYLPPSVMTGYFRWTRQNSTVGDIRIDELTVDIIDYVAEVTVVVKSHATDGTVSWGTFAPVWGLQYCTLRVTEIDKFNGTLTVTGNNGTLNVVSTDPADRNKRVRVSVEPHRNYNELAWPTDGA